MQDDLATALTDQSAIDLQVVIGVLGETAQRTACHQDDLAAMPLNVADLFLIGGGDFV